MALSGEVFSAMRVRNFRLYTASQGITTTGTWMQIIAQDWLVLQLTGSPAAVGVTMTLQFLPMLVFGVYGGMLADRFPKRRLLMATQTANGVVHQRARRPHHLRPGAGLGGVRDHARRRVRLRGRQPDPAGLRQRAGAEVYVRNGIGLNAAVFQSTRLIGPAVAGVLISTVGSGWAFAAAAACFLLPMLVLMQIRYPRADPCVRRRSRASRDSCARPCATSPSQPHLAWTIFLVGVLGTFGLNFPIVLTSIARDSFHGGAGLYALFNIMLAVGFGDRGAHRRCPYPGTAAPARGRGDGLRRGPGRRRAGDGRDHVPRTAHRHGRDQPRLPGDGQLLRPARLLTGASRSRDGALHAGLRRWDADRGTHRRAP